MVCSFQFRCRPRNNHIWVSFSARKVHSDFHDGCTSLQTYSPRHKSYFIIVFALHALCEHSTLSYTHGWGPSSGGSLASYPRTKQHLASTGINCEVSATASQVGGVTYTMPALCLFILLFFKTGCSRTHYIDQIGLRLTEIYLYLPGARTRGIRHYAPLFIYLVFSNRHLLYSPC